MFVYSVKKRQVVLMVSPLAAAVLPDAAVLVGAAVLVEAEEPPHAVRAAALPRTADAFRKLLREIFFIIVLQFCL